MKSPFINEGIFEPHKSVVERGEYIYIYIYEAFFFFEFNIIF